MHGDLVQEFLRLQTLVLAPVCPHVAERCWARLGKTTTVRAPHPYRTWL